MDYIFIFNLYRSFTHIHKREYDLSTLFRSEGNDDVLKYLFRTTEQVIPKGITEKLPLIKTYRCEGERNSPPPKPINFRYASYN